MRRLKRLMVKSIVCLLVVFFSVCGVVKAEDKKESFNNTSVSVAEYCPPEPAIEEPDKIEIKKHVCFVPRMDQNEYANVPYGNFGSIAEDGCGIVVIAMIASYMLDDMADPAGLAEQFGQYNTEFGSCWTLFENSAAELGLGNVEETTSWERVEYALKKGQLVVCSQGPGLFTKTGHFILLTGLTDEGLVKVNDPNSQNYQKPQLKNGFENGFTKSQIHETAKVYFIYEAKQVQEERLEAVAP